jgi:creatinine amidohydrolase
VTLPLSNPWRFDALTRDELNAIAATSTIVIPLGSTEQHAHHLPVRVDAAVITALAERAVVKASAQVPVLLGPTLPYGFSHHHLVFGGTISIGPTTYISVLTDIATSLAQQGFRNLVFLNGHGGNESAMHLVADRLGCDSGVNMNVAACSYWTLAEEMAQVAGLEPSLVPGHAGHFETSLMLAIEPDLVRLDLRPTDVTPASPIGTPDLAGAVIRRPGLWQASDGRTDDAQRASPETGLMAISYIVDRIADFLVEFHHSTAGN